MKKEIQDEKRELKRLAREQVKKLTKELVGESDWNLLEMILQEIIATYVCQGQARPSLENLRQILAEEVNLRYKDNERVRNILLEAIPSMYALSTWVKKAGWDEAVWGYIKNDGLFTSERRAALISAIYDRAKTKSDSAAKLWLTMSGDYSDKLDVNADNTMDQFREIQQAIFSNKNK